MATTMSTTVKMMLSRFLSGTGFSPARLKACIDVGGVGVAEYFDVLRLEILPNF